MSGRGPRPIAGLVDRLLRGLGIAADVDRAGATRAWRGAAARILGPDATTTTALRVEGTTLVVAVPTSGWAGEIRLRESQLLAALAEASPRSGITAIRTVPGAQRRERAGPGSGGEGADTP